MKHILLLLLLCVLSTSAFADTFGNMCELINNRQLEYSKVLPLTIDDITVFTNFNSNCETKTIEYKYQIFADRSELKKSEIKTKFVKFVNIQCKKGYPKHGWDVINNYYDKNSKLLFKFVVKATDCKRLSRKHK